MVKKAQMTWEAAGTLAGGRGKECTPAGAWKLRISRKIRTCYTCGTSAQCKVSKIIT